MLDQYQIDAIHKLKPGSILCGGVGSGKSRTAIAYYYISNGGLISPFYKPMNSPQDLYIITTARKRDTLEWESELAFFGLYPDYSEQYQNKIIIDSWNNIKKYTEVSNSFFIFDEQRVVGSGAWAKSFIKISKSNKWILLSATPGDTWMDYIPVFIANGFYKNRTEFINKHVIYKRIHNFYKVDRYVGQGELIRHRRDILVDMDYKRPTQHHHKTEIVSYDREKYKMIMKERWNIFENRPVENVSELCSLVRKVTNTDASRIEIVKSIALMNNRVIIFYNFDYELELLKNIELEGYAISEWNGHKHEPIPETEKWLYLVQYAAGAEGWNCTKTDTIIFYSQSYSYKTMIQAAGRIDRRNSPYKHLYYYHLRSNSSIDLGIYQALKRKENFNESTFIHF